MAGTQPTNLRSLFELQNTSFSTLGTGGFLVEWEAMEERSYDLYRSTNDLADFQMIATNLTVGIYTDAVDVIERAVYKVKVRYQP